MRVKSFLGTTLIAAGSVMGLGAPALAAPIDGLYVFGDSLSDTGNIYRTSGGSLPVSPPYSEGRFTNGDVWIQDFAAARGGGAVAPSLAGGNDFAFGGAQTGATPVHDANPTDLTAQVDAFDVAVPTPNANALYTLWIGSNDVNALIGALTQGTLSPDGVDADIARATDNVDAAVQNLAADGMTDLLALGVPDLSRTPDSIAAANDSADPAATLAFIRELSASFNARLRDVLETRAAADGFDLSLVDTFGAIDRIVADPEAFGLRNATDSCWTGDFTDSSSGRVCANPDDYLFWDGLHPTAAGHRLIARSALAALTTNTRAVTEPGQIGLLAVALIGLLSLSWRRRRALSREDNADT